MSAATTTYDVRIWDIRAISGNRRTYQVRWKVATRQRTRNFATRKFADSFRAGLLTAARKGEPFDLSSGLPVSQLPKEATPLWLDFARDFVDVKWPDSSPRHRKSTAEGLVTITLAMLRADEVPPDPKVARHALMHWAFNTSARQKDAQPPEDFAEALEWIGERSRPVGDLEDADVIRAVLKTIALKLDGSAAAASTTNRKRAALSSAIGYALEKGYLTGNPLHRVKVKRRQAHAQVDARSVLNHQQFKAYLNKVRTTAPDMAAFYGCIYYAAMRPGEVRNLKRQNLHLPDTGWGEAVLGRSYQVPGRTWTDDGQAGEERSLKHRDESATRPVPLAPPLVVLLREHLERFATDSRGRLFVVRVGPGGHPLAGGFGGPVGEGAIARVHRQARAAIFTQAQRDSPLARRAYDLRHAAVSTWLAAGVPPTQVAAWAGHSVAVLLTVYAHAIDGQAETAKKRIEAALRVHE